MINDLPDYKIALNNSVIHRNSILTNNKKPIFELNPYTDIDKLIFRLMQLPIDYCWFNNNEEVKCGSLSIKVDGCSNNKLRITLTNQNVTSRFMLEQNSCGLVNSCGEILPFGERCIIEQNHIIEFDLSNIKNFIPLYISFKIGENLYLITDL